MRIEDQIRENIDSIQKRIDNSELLCYLLKCEEDNVQPKVNLFKKNGYTNEDIQIAEQLIDMYIKLNIIWDKFNTEKRVKN